MGAYCLANNQISLLRILEKWKFLSLKELRDELSFRQTDSALRKTLDKLVKKNFLRKLAGPLNGEVIYQLTKNGINSLGQKGKFLLDDTFVRHDWITAKLARTFRCLGYFDKCIFPHEIVDSTEFNALNSVEPDAFLLKINGTQIFWTALEVETSRKAASRIKSKFFHYLENKNYHKVIYAFDQRSDFDIYITLLQSVKAKLNETEIEELHQKFIFFFHPRLDQITNNFHDALWFSAGEQKKIEEVLL